MIKFEKLPPQILSRIPKVQKTLEDDDNVVFAYLFGGLAAGRANPLSDVDIAVYVRDAGNLADYKLSLFDRLTDALGTTELDLVVLNTAPVSIAGRVLQHKQLLVDKEPFRRHTYESLTLREFFDFRIMEEALFTRRYGIGR
jgi:predicted nucleotidyltransferase